MLRSAPCSSAVDVADVRLPSISVLNGLAVKLISSFSLSESRAGRDGQRILASGELAVDYRVPV